MIRLFIGVDEVEMVAYHALVQSIINKTKVPVSITPLKLSMLPEYKRKRDPKQSNEFSFSRFLVPYLCNYEGHAIFMDLDMMLRVDLNELWKLRDNSSVQVVKHDYTPKTQVKYLGAIQYKYPRKNWSSVMLFNCAHDHCKRLTPGYVNSADGLALHRFYWTHEDYIGELPVAVLEGLKPLPVHPDSLEGAVEVGGLEGADAQFVRLRRLETAVHRARDVLVLGGEHPVEAIDGGQIDRDPLLCPSPQQLAGSPQLEPG